MADISNIDWSPLVYDGLTIPDEKKEMIMALAESRMGRGDYAPSNDVSERQRRAAPARFDDFVEGKGRGLIVLLQYGLAILLHHHALTHEIVVHQGLGRP